MMWWDKEKRERDYFVPTETDGSRLYPIVYKDRTYLPLRAIAEKAGVKVNWDESTQTIYFEVESKTPTPVPTTTPTPTPTPDSSLKYYSDPTNTVNAKINNVVPSLDNVSKIQGEFKNSTPMSIYYTYNLTTLSSDEVKTVLTDYEKLLENNGFKTFKSTIGGMGNTYLKERTAEVTVNNVEGKIDIYIVKN